MKKYLVQWITILSSLSFLLLLFGFGWTIQSQFFGSVTATAAKTTEATSTDTISEGMTIIALGDSLTRGTGDSNGKGYVGYLVDRLKEQSSEEITLRNLGVKGYRSDQLLNQVKQSEIKRQIQDADIILMTMGGNDLFQSGQTLIDLDPQKIDQLREEYLLNMQQIMGEIRSVNKEAAIYYVGLYNPFINLADAEITTQAVRQWNHETSELLDKDHQAVFVPTYDLFQINVDQYLFSDKFHPNTEGYQLIAERVAGLIK
ncbi:GDSL-type esterase/lipase family protein [Ammoniphilus sp. 3BR4]|uniref:GDSL-type esterase/lipase family protein n=1 Tax=Ammoniphilus sp. 3BR4 TaxID=3158265 RepID=UPI003464FD69